MRTICALHYLEKDKYPTLCLSPNQKVFLKDLREKIRRWKQQNEERMVRSGIVQRVRLYRLPGVLQKVCTVCYKKLNRIKKRKITNPIRSE